MLKKNPETSPQKPKHILLGLILYSAATLILVVAAEYLHVFMIRKSSELTSDSLSLLKSGVI